MRQSYSSDQCVHGAYRSTQSLTLRYDPSVGICALTIDRKKVAGKDLLFELPDQFIESTSAFALWQFLDTVT